MRDKSTPFGACHASFGDGCNSLYSVIEIVEFETESTLCDTVISTPGAFLSLNIHSVSTYRWPWFLAAALTAMLLGLALLIVRLDSGLLVIEELREPTWQEFTLMCGLVLIPGALMYIGLLPNTYRQAPYPERILRVALLLCFLVCLIFQNIGCHIPELKMKIQETRNEQPVFDFTTGCFSLQGIQRENEYDLRKLELWQIDKNGKRIECVWKVAQLPGGEQHPKYIVYGQVPMGWKHLKPAEPLKDGCIYNLNDGVVFLRENRGTYTVLPGKYYYPDRIAKQLKKMRKY
jgi:hypothetical protein